MNFNRVVTLLLLVFIIAVPALCSAEGEITLVVTDGFSRPPMVEKEVAADGRSCMEILKDSATVETAYGGGFVVSVDGVGGKDGKGAWFYYVNGLLSDVGAAQRVPRRGDVVQWDFHPWSPAELVSAVIGSYPRPFVPEGCAIVRSQSMAAPCARLASALRGWGAARVSVIPLEESAAPPVAGPAIVVGTPAEIGRAGWVAKLFGGRQGMGPFVEFCEGGVVILGTAGRRGERLENAGVITAVKDGWGASARALWLVTGTDEKSLLPALDLLARKPRAVAFLSGALVTEEGVRNVPAP